MGENPIRVSLEIPKDEKWKKRDPKGHGEHFGYDGREGVIIAGAGKTGAWVEFEKGSYVGCPLKWLRRIEHKT